jgi:hypothetical protein
MCLFLRLTLKMKLVHFIYLCFSYEQKRLKSGRGLRNDRSNLVYLYVVQAIKGYKI